MLAFECKQPAKDKANSRFLISRAPLCCDEIGRKGPSNPSALGGGLPMRLGQAVVDVGVSAQIFRIETGRQAGLELWVVRPVMPAHC